MSEEEIFLAALEIKSPQERAAYLAAACAGDESLRRRVASLLASDERAGSFLLQPPLEIRGDPAISPTRLDSDSSQPSALSAPDIGVDVGAQIGPYRLIEKIGEGGMGVVYVAQQERPVRRLVALKIVKPGMDSRQVIARFEAERQALALMNHPNIATVFDAGMTEQRRPYFVMELVKGVPITQFCDENQLTPRERLELFIPVCEAIQHAHQKGIIHRDIKPGNVLVACYDERAVPKVIDYGVAKALGPSIIEDAAVTSFGGIVGTLYYMSPEQATFNALDVDTRSDVYALGALLYELLTGSPPLKEKLSEKVAVQALLEVIRQTQPLKPSTRLSGSGAALPALAARRRADPAALGRAFRGELDLIVMKALHKDRSQRYDSASGLARDVKHYLAGEEVEACPPTLRYRLGKFLHRHRGPVLAAGLVLAALLAVAIGTSWGMIRTRRFADAEARQRRIADRETAVATANAERATANEALSQQNETKARQNAAAAELRVVEGLVSQADAMAEAGRWADAKELYWDAYNQFKSLGASPFRAEIGLTAAYAVSPPPLLTFENDGGPIRGVAFSPDGHRALSTSIGVASPLLLWDLPLGRPIRAIAAKSAYNFAFSPDGRTALSFSYAEHLIQLWDLDSGKELTRIPTPLALDSIAFTPDGRRAVATDDQTGVSFWDLDTRKEVDPFPGKIPPTRQMAISSDATRALTGDKAGALHVYDLSTGKELRTIQAHPAEVKRIAISSDGLRGISSIDSTLKLWDLQTGSELQSLVGHQQGVNDVVFGPGGLTALSGGGMGLGWSRDSSVRLWDLQTGSATRILTGHLEAVDVVAMSADGALGLSGSGASFGRSIDNSLKLWDLRNAGDARTLMSHGYVSSIAITPDNRLALSGGQGGAVLLWDLDAGRFIRSFKGHADGAVRCVAISPDARRALSGSSYNTVRLWDLQTGENLQTIQGDSTFTGVAFGPPDVRWALASTRNAIHVINVNTGKDVRTFGNSKEGINALALSADGHIAVSAVGGPFDRTHFPLMLWDVQTGHPLSNFFTLEDAGVDSVALSRDGRYLLSGGFDRSVRLWDLQTHKQIWQMMGHTTVVESVAFSPDGLWAISGDGNGVVRLWDLKTGRELRTLHGHSKEVAAVAFSPNGQAALTAGSDETIRIWDFWRPADYRVIESRGRASRSNLARTKIMRQPDAPWALRTMGEWYAFRGVNNWAIELSEKARAGGEIISSPTLGRYWALSDDLPPGSSLTRESCLAAARREFKAALEDSKDPQQRAYLQLLLDSPALIPGAATRPATHPATQSSPAGS